MENDPVNPFTQRMAERDFVQSHLEPPDPASSLYINRTWSVNEDLSENHEISGVKVIFDKAEDTQGLYAIYHVDRSKVIDTKPNLEGQVRQLTICADQLVVRGELSLPEIDVSIFARELIFEDRDGEPGRINTSPLAFAMSKAADYNPTTKSAAQDGAPGRTAGDMQIYLARLQVPSDSGGVKRFIQNGGSGQGAGNGLAGQNGTTMQYCSVFNWDVKGTCGKSHFKLNFDVPAVYVDMEIRWGASRVGGSTWGAPLFPTNGTDAMPPGKPGNGGDGGKFTSNLDLSAYVENLGGKCGQRGPAVRGGSAGRPTKSAHWKAQCWDNLFHYPGDLSYSKTATYETKAGASYPSPRADKEVGATHGLVCTGEANAWLHPDLLITTLGYAREAFLAEARDNLAPLLGEYHLALGQPPAPSIGAGETSDLFDPAQYQSFQTEVTTLLQRLDGGLDYFGHPAGWTPLLSLPASLKLYDNEVLWSLRALVLARWITDESKQQEQAANAMTHAISGLNEDTRKAAASLEAAENTIKSLVNSTYSLEQDLAGLKIELETLRAKLLAEAKTNESVKAAINMATKTFSAVCSVIPYGQPALAAVGNLATVVANYDSEDPCNTVGELAGVFSGLAKAKLDDTAARIVAEAKKDGQEEKGVSEADKAKAKADRLTQVGNNLGPALADITGAIKGLRVPQSEIDAELSRLEAQTPEFGELSGKIKQLNIRKAEYARQLDLASQTVGSAFSRITNNLTSIRVLDPQRKQTLGRLNHAAQLYVRDMGKRAQDRLIEYLYYLVKSYESTILEPCTDISYSLPAIFDKISNLLVGAGAQTLTADNLTKFAEALKPLFDDNRRQLEQKLLAGYRREFTMNISSRLSSDQTPEVIKALNQQGEATLDLKDLGLVLADRERIRIGGVAIKKILLRGVTRAASGTAELSFEPKGDGTIRSADQLYAVRSWTSGGGDGTTNSGSQQLWGATFPIKQTDKLTLIEPSKETEELLNALLGGTSAEIKEKLIKPPAWTEMKIRYRRYTTNAQPDLKSVELNWTLNFTPLTSTDHFVLDVSVADSLAPLVCCTPADINSRANGSGKVYRIYPRSTQVTLEVPDSYGKWQFNHWELINTDTGKPEKGAFRNHLLAICIDTNLKAIAHYSFGGRVLYGRGTGRVKPARSEETTIAAETPLLSGVMYHSASLENGIPIGNLELDSTYALLEGPTKIDGRDWWLVDYKGLIGWVAG